MDNKYDDLNENQIQLLHFISTVISSLKVSSISLSAVIVGGLRAIYILSSAVCVEATL